jgi:predicted nucleic acid-binding protein
MSGMRCEPVPELGGNVYARITRAGQVKGESLDENDLWIAATAMVLGAVLVSRDKDFLKVVGLTVEDWTK